MSAGKRVTLSGLAPAVAAPAARPAPAARVGTPAPSKAPQSTPETKPAPAVVATVTAPLTPAQVAPREAKWTTFERKDARIRSDQADWLDATRKRLNKSRAGTGERLTDNTLLRVAIDFLRKHESDLGGTTEEELRRSLGL